MEVNAVGSSHYVINAPNVISEEVAGQTVVIDFESGRYFSLNESGSSVWKTLQSGATPETLAERASGDRRASTLETLEAFVATLATAGLVRTEPGAPPAAAEPLVLHSTPRLDSFDDLQDILLLDPIHEVDEKGWPHATTPIPPK